MQNSMIKISVCLKHSHSHFSIYLYTKFHNISVWPEAWFRACCVGNRQAVAYDRAGQRWRLMTSTFLYSLLLLFQRHLIRLYSLRSVLHCPIHAANERYCVHAERQQSAVIYDFYNCNTLIRARWGRLLSHLLVTVNSQPTHTWDIAFYKIQLNRDDLSMWEMWNERVCLLNVTATDVDVLMPALIHAKSILCTELPNC